MVNLNDELGFSRQLVRDLTIAELRVNQKVTASEVFLTIREEEILFLVASGENNKDIARDLYLSPHTVRGHLSSIFRKINVKTRLQAAMWVSKYLEFVGRRKSKII